MQIAECKLQIADFVLGEINLLAETHVSLLTDRRAASLLVVTSGALGD